MPSVLIVDDDRAVRHLVREALGSRDVDVIEAATVDDGLRLLRDSQPDVVLLDIMLPELSGLEAFHKFHALDPKVPVIFITAMNSSDAAIQAMTLGAYDFMLKPLAVDRCESWSARRWKSAA